MTLQDHDNEQAYPLPEGFAQRLQAGVHQRLAAQRRQRQRRSWLAAAAAVAVAIGLSLWLPAGQNQLQPVAMDELQPEEIATYLVGDYELTDYELADMVMAEQATTDLPGEDGAFDHLDNLQGLEYELAPDDIELYL